MNKKLQIVLVPHKSAKNLVVSYFREDWPKIPLKDLLKKRTDFEIILTKPIKDATVSDLIKVVKKQKYWAYCQHFKDEKQYKEIHYWIMPGVDNAKILNLFAHELTHATGINSEKRACDVAEICEFAYNILLEDILNENKKIRK